MAPICDCGEHVPTDEDVARCATDNHRRALIRQAREALEATPIDDRDDAFYQAMGELQMLENQTPPRPPDAAEVIDLIAVIEKSATASLEASGMRPTTMIVAEDMAAQIRRVAEAFPAVLGRRCAPTHERPASFERSDAWLGQVSGIDIFESREASDARR